MESFVTVEKLHAYNKKDAAEIGHLLHSLSPKFTDEPITETLLREIIDSVHHEQLVARHEGSVVGIATLSITIGAGAGRKAYLEDFVVDLNVRSKGVGTAVWDEIIAWCLENDLKLHFTSNATREAARRFYLSHGATIYETTVFHYDPRQH